MNRSKSKEWFDRACAVMPGGVNSPVRSFKSVDVAPVYFERAEGAYLYDVDGNTYTDFCMSFGPHILGHSHPSVVAAIKSQADLATSFGACHPGEVRLAQKIVSLYRFCERVRMVSSGTEATMTLVRLARAFTGRSKIVKFDGCYHGHADLFLTRSGSGLAELTEASSAGVPSGISADTLVASFDDLAGLERHFEQVGEQIAAVILEPVPANYGLWNPGRQVLERIIAAAHSHGALVIFDEVITGLRLSASGACGYFDLKPDLISLGKIAGGGMPLAAIAGRADLIDLLAPLGAVYQAGTLSGNPVATAAALAVLEQLEVSPPYAQLEFACTAFVEGLREILPEPCTVRQVGSMFWILLDEEPRGFPPAVSSTAQARYSELFRRALDAGVYLSPSPYEVGFISTAQTPEILSTVLTKLGGALEDMG